MPSKKENQYYAVIKGYLDVPTIFSSWGEASPLVTGCPGAFSKGFRSLKDAEEYMREKGHEVRTVEKAGAGQTTASSSGQAYYAVAHGRNKGVYLSYNGEGNAEPEVKGFSGACQQRFPTKEQADAFIDDWERSNARVQAKIKEGFAGGRHPTKMEGRLLRRGLKTENDEIKQELSDGHGPAEEDIKEESSDDHVPGETTLTPRARVKTDAADDLTDRLSHLLITE